MITLARDCLLFQLSNGETVPFSADMISVELAGDTTRWFDPETANQAAKAVFHYFKNELQRNSVTAEEFAKAMEKALSGLQLAGHGMGACSIATPVIEADLWRMAKESGIGCELLFFPRLRNDMREHLRQKPRLLRYHGLRRCVKEIAGARRWTSRCQDLEEQIVSFVRECAGADRTHRDLALMVE